MLNTKKEISIWLKKNGVEDYQINNDLTVNVFKSVDLSRKGMDVLPINFGKIRGDFDISKNALKTLEGFPELIEGRLDASFNQIVDFKKSKLKKINGCCNLSHNKIQSLENFPKNVGESIYLQVNGLKDLKGLPEKINGVLNIMKNDLISMRGVPEIIEDIFRMDVNPWLEDFDDIPKSVGKWIISREMVKFLFKVPDEIKNGVKLWSDGRAESYTYEEFRDLVEQNQPVILRNKLKQKIYEQLENNKKLKI